MYTLKIFTTSGTVSVCVFNRYTKPEIIRGVNPLVFGWQVVSVAVKSWSREHSA